MIDKAALAYGMKSPDLVRARLKAMLKSGLYKGPISGVWDHNSRSAWEKYARFKYRKNINVNKKPNSTNLSDLGFGGNTFKYVANKLGFKPNSAMAGIGGLGVYMIPGLGAIASTTDAYNSFKRGDWKSGLRDSLFAATSIVPGLGLIGGGAKLLRAANAANKISKLSNTIKASKPMMAAHGALGADMAINFAPEMGKLGYNSYLAGKELSNLRALLIDHYKKQGITENLLQDAAKNDKDLLMVLNSTNSLSGAYNILKRGFSESDENLNS